MTGIIEDGTENPFIVISSIASSTRAVETKTSPGGSIVELKARLSTALRDIKVNKAGGGPNTERRMVPSVARKKPHTQFRRTSR